MKTLILYDSIFGNTQKIAQAIATALDCPDVLQVVNANLNQLSGLDLLIVGSPTRGFRPTPAITAFLKSIPKHGLQGVNVAAFDTRIELSTISSGVLRTMVNFFGYAAQPIAKQLQKKGGNLILPPTGFFVDASEGPLTTGELERAAIWAQSSQH
jgi:flavodoxin